MINIASKKPANRTCKPLRRPILTSLFTLFALLASTTALAHKPSDSYLTLKIAEQQLLLQWDINLRDANFNLQLDDNADGKITWAELSGAQAAVVDWALAGLQLERAGQACGFSNPDLLVDKHSDGGYLVLRFAAQCAAADGEFQLHYSLLFEQDPTHRGLLKLQLATGDSQTILSPESATFSFSADQVQRISAGFGKFFVEGVWHIWIGYDHILFLLSLLLPAVLILNAANSRAARWSPHSKLTDALWPVVKIVTAFTIAHSITLALAATGAINLPIQWVEVVIALSVALAAINNLIPVFRQRLWLITFAFGLIHGFGFASVFADLGLRSGNLISTVLAFNLGVEAGQLVIVAVFLPFAWALRHSLLYRRVVLNGGSLTIAAFGFYWAITRAIG